MDEIIFVDENGQPIDFSKYMNPNGPTNPDSIPIAEEPSKFGNFVKNVVAEFKNPKKLAKDVGMVTLDMLKHPSETVFNMGLMGSLAGFGKGFMLPLGLAYAGANDILRKGDENIAKFADHIIRNPGDLGHLIKGAAMDWFDFDNPRGE
jgi:hypothetical protein